MTNIDSNHRSSHQPPASIAFVPDPGALNRRWARDAVIWWSVVVLSATLAQAGPGLMLPVAWLLMGIAQHAIGALAHEGLHWHVHVDRRINELLTRMCAWPLGFSVASWRAWHFAHHAHVGGPCDPEQPLKRAHEARWHRRAFLQGARDALGLSADEMLEFWYSVNRSHVARTAAWQAAAFLAIVAAGGWKIVALWSVALMSSQVVVFRLRVKTEHDIGQESTKFTPRPPRWKRATYLTCTTWRHFEHHARPGLRYSQFV